ncbi:MAG: PaaI family thioesterase [Candidatus Binataceae bacterium]
MGISLLSAGGGRACAKLNISPAVMQPTGLYHAGAIVSLADTTATSACLAETNPNGEPRADLFPLAIQISSNLVRNTNEGGLTADAEIIHRGRTTMVVNVRVADERGRLVANTVVTLLAPAGISAESEG